MHGVGESQSGGRIGSVYWVWLIAVLVLAAGLRLIALDRYPVLVNQDELSNMYDGWSIAETGADRSGRGHPILCYGGGPRDERPALMAWLCAGAYELFGFSPEACRGISGIVGVASIALAGWWAWSIAGRYGALIGMVLLSVSPWHVLFSREAHEGKALPGLFCVAIILTLRRACARVGGSGVSLRRWVIAGLVIGFSTNAYAATRLSGLLFAILGAVVCLCVVRTTTRDWRQVVLAVMVYVAAVTMGASPQIYAFVSDPSAFVGRARTVVMDVFGWWDAVETVSLNVVANLAPRYLFYSFADPDALTVARLSVVAMPFFYIGLLSLVWPGGEWAGADRAILLSAVLFCIAPAAVTRTNPHALRASACAVLFPMISCLGMVVCGRWLERWWSAKTSARNEGAAVLRANRMTVVAVVVILTVGGSYVWRYLDRPDLHAVNQQPRWVAMGRWLRDNADRYDRICIAPHGSSWDLYVAAFSGMSPAQFQRTERTVWGRYADFCIRLGKYHFDKRDEAMRQWEASSKNEHWLVTDVGHTYEFELGSPHR